MPEMGHDRIRPSRAVPVVTRRADSLAGVDVTERFNVHVTGPQGAPPMLFAHGFGCDQNMWRFVAPQFTSTHRVVLFDFAGAGGADRAAYDESRHSSLSGYADDVLEICAALHLQGVTFVGHSVSAMIGALAVLAEPERFVKLVMVGPSPRYIDDGSYVGGFTEDDISELLESLSSNYLGWSAGMAPVIMGNPERPHLGEELTASFCRTDPDIARRFAEVTFRSDNRSDLARIPVPTLVLQSRDDAIAPTTVGEYVRDAIPRSTYVVLDAVGHCPNLSAPDETTRAIAEFVDASPP